MTAGSEQVRAVRWPDFASGPLVALELLSVLRLRRAPLLSDRVFGASQAWFPAVGLLFGAALYGLDQALDGYLPPNVMGWLLAGTLIVLSGGLHVDGLADSADGLFGGETREERLRIMHEGSIGAFGAAAVLLSLALKATAIASLTSLRPETLVLAPVIGRWSMNTAIAAYPYARPQGLGKAFHATALPWPALLATTITAVAVLVLLGPRGLVPAAIAAALALGLGRFMKERLGGLTGDTYGAIVEVAEVVFLLLVLALTADGWLA